MLHIFGTVYNPTSGKFAAFNADTGTVLSVHKTQDGATRACQRYEARQLRRLKLFPLADLAHSTIAAAFIMATVAIAKPADHWRACGTSPHSGHYFCTEYVGIPRHK